MAKKKNFTVAAEIKLHLGVNVKAEGMDEAIKKAKELTLDDFVTIEAEEHISDEMEIEGVWTVD